MPVFLEARIDKYLKYTSINVTWLAQFADQSPTTLGSVVRIYAASPNNFFLFSTRQKDKQLEVIAGVFLLYISFIFEKRNNHIWPN